MQININPTFAILEELTQMDEPENYLYFYHTDLPIAIGIGSSSWISNASGQADQHLANMPYGEDFINERNTRDIRFKFTGKERDAETGFGYFGARYYNSDLSIWLSVDPMAHERSWVSPYSYCQNIPIIRTDPTGALDWLPPTDGSGNWTAQKGDSPGSLARDAHITQAEAESAVKSANQARGEVRTSETMVYKDDVVNVGSRPGYVWNSGSSTTNSSATATQNTPSTPSNNSGSQGNTAQTVNTVANVVGLTAGATKEILQIPNVGYNIANNPTLLKGVNYLKPVGYWATGISVGSDVVLSVNGQQSWTETGVNTAVTGVAIGVGGWLGVLIQLDYMAAKAYIKTVTKHPEYFEGIPRGR